jgi:hypothetical protein
MKDKLLVKLGEISVSGFGFGNYPQGGFRRNVYGVRVGGFIVGKWELKTARAAAKLSKAGINIASMSGEDVRYAAATGKVMQ